MRKVTKVFSGFQPNNAIDKISITITILVWNCRSTANVNETTAVPAGCVPQRGSLVNNAQLDCTIKHRSFSSLYFTDKLIQASSLQSCDVGYHH